MLPSNVKFGFLILCLFKTGVKSLGNYMASNFKKPEDGDIRGPCPAMNILANYDIINRNGTDIPADDIVMAFVETFGLNSVTVFPFMEFLHQNGLQIDDRGDGRGGTVALSNFYSSMFDAHLLNSASVVSGHNHPLYSEELLQGFAEKCEDGVCTAQVALDRLKERYREECESDNPFPIAETNSEAGLSKFHAIRAGTTLEIFTTRGVSEEELTLNSTITLETVRLLMDENRLPDDFVSRTESGIAPYATSDRPLFKSNYAELCKVAAELYEGGCTAIPLCPPLPAPAEMDDGNDSQETEESTGETEEESVTARMVDESKEPDIKSSGQLGQDMNVYLTVGTAFGITVLIGCM